MACEDGTHNKVVKDRFALDFKIGRIPGDCYCMDCHSPIAAWWNGGRPVAIDLDAYEKERKSKNKSRVVTA